MRVRSPLAPFLLWRGREVWSSRDPHKFKIAGSNPAPAPKRLISTSSILIIGVKYTDMRVDILLIDKHTLIRQVGAALQLQNG